MQSQSGAVLGVPVRAADVVETKADTFKTLKRSAGDTGQCLQEWVMNTVSATDVDGAPAKGEATLRPVNGVMCLVLDSETVVKSGAHRADMMRASLLLFKLALPFVAAFTGSSAETDACVC